MFALQSLFILALRSYFKRTTSSGFFLILGPGRGAFPFRAQMVGAAGNFGPIWYKHCGKKHNLFLPSAGPGLACISSPSGYVAIGFTDIAGSMGPADAYAGWIGATGRVRTPLTPNCMFWINQRKKNSRRVILSGRFFLENNKQSMFLWMFMTYQCTCFFSVSINIM